MANVQDVKSRELTYNARTIVNEFYCAAFIFNKKFVPALP